MSSIHRTVARNSAILMATTAGVKLLMFVLNVLIINRLDEDSIARFGVAWSWGMLISSAVDFGSRTYLLREMGRWEDDPAALLRLVRRCRLLQLTNYLAALVIFGPLLWAAGGYDALLLGEIGLFSVMGYFDAAGWQSKYALRGLHLAHYEPRITLIGRSVVILLVLGLIGLDHLSVALIALCFVVGTMVEAIRGWVFLSREIEALRPPSGGSEPAPRILPSLGQLYGRIAPFGTSIFAQDWTMRLPFVLLPVLGTARTLTWFTTAFKLPEAGTFLPGNVMSAVLPAMVSKDEGKVDLRRSARVCQVLEYMIAAGIVCGGLLSLEALAVVDILFRADLAPAAIALKLLGAWLGLLFLERAAGACLIALGGERRMMLASTTGLGIGIVVAILAMPSYGLVGAAGSIIAGMSAHIVVVLSGLSARDVHLEWTVLRRPIACGLTLMIVWHAADAFWPGTWMFWLRSGMAALAAGAAFLAVTWPNRSDDFLFRTLRGTT